MNRVELNGRPATAEDLGGLAFAGYGHLTSMQMRAHRVRGFDLHLERLATRPRSRAGSRWSPTCWYGPARRWRRRRSRSRSGPPVVGVDGVLLEHDPSLLATLLRCYRSNHGRPVA